MWGSNFGYCRGEKNRKKSRIHQTHQSIDVFKDVKRKQTLSFCLSAKLQNPTRHFIFSLYIAGPLLLFRTIPTRVVALN